jgi:hypothetical protein
VSIDLDAIRARLAAATPGPWELGDVWFRAGVIYDETGVRNGDAPTRCAYCHHGDPVFVEPDMDVNGTRMVGHIHRSADPYDPEHTVSGADGTVVLVGRGDYGPYVSEEDAAFIAGARQDVADLLAEVERLRAIESPVRALEDRNGDVWVLDVHPPRYKRDHYSSPMPRDFIEKHYGPVVEVGS